MKKSILLSAVVLLILTTLCVLRPGRDALVSSDSRVDAPKLQTTARNALRQHRNAPVRLPSDSESPFQFHTSIPEAPAWSIAYGREFWRRSAEASEVAAKSQGTPSNVNLEDIMDRVSHAIRLSEGGLPQVNGRTYVATWDEATLRFSPKQYAGEVPWPGETARQSIPQFYADPMTEATFRTTEIRRGTEVLATSGSAATPLSIVGNTAQRALDEQAGVLEHYEAGEEGVEVTWIIQAPPAGQGALEIEALLEGLNYSGQSAKGALFADATGTPRIFVGHVEFVDAAGSRGNLPLSVEGSRLRVEVPETILAATQFPLAIDPTIGAEFPLSNPGSEQRTPAIASIGSQYLVAWTDTLNGNADIIAARVTADGALLDPNGIMVYAGAGYQDVGSVAAWYGSGYLVVWLDQSDYNIYGAPVINGTPGSRFNISTHPAIKGKPSVGFCPISSKFLVAWPDNRHGSYSDIYGIIVAESWQTQGSEVPISMGAYNQTSPKVAGVGNAFFVVWQDHRSGSYSDIWGTRVSDVGAVLDPSGVQISSGGLDELSPAITGVVYTPPGDQSYQSYFIAWQDYRSGNADIWGRRVRVGGSLCGYYCLDPEVSISVVAGSGQGSPAVAHSGSQILVAWQDGRNAATTGQDIYGATVSDPGTIGNVSPGASYIINNKSGDQLYPAVAAGAGHFLVAHQSHWDSCVPKIRANKVVTAGPTIGADFAVVNNNSPGDQKTPVIGSLGSEYLVAWTDTIGGNADIRAARVSGEGTVIDLSGITVRAAAGHQQVGSVAGGSGGYLVVWEDLSNYNIYGAKVVDGVADQPLNICVVSAIKGKPSVAYVPGTPPEFPSRFLVTWQDQRFGSYSDIFGALVLVNGTWQVQSDFPISMGAYNQNEPKVAGAVSGFFVVWKDYRSGFYADIWGSRVSTTGSALDSSGIQLTSGGYDEYSPSIAGYQDNGNGGQTYFVAWQDYRNGNGDIFGRRIRVGGAACQGVPYCLNAEIPIVVLTSGQGSPSVGQSGRHFLVAWQDGRNSATSGQDIYGATIFDPSDTTPVYLLGSPYAINNNSGDQLYPAVSGGTSHFLVGHQSLWNCSVPKIRANRVVTVD